MKYVQCVNIQYAKFEYDKNENCSKLQITPLPTRHPLRISDRKRA